MAKMIYKYFSAVVLDLVFQRSGFCGLKCSLPIEYNDPYELFLGVDLQVGPDLLAIYREFVQELPQYPTTCFSNSLTVTPMWAHYANNHSGFVVEFDVPKLQAAFNNLAIRNVSYKDQPNESIKDFLLRAAIARKPRHAVWLQQLVLSEAYFSKYTAWSYERECRLVDDAGNCEDVSGSDILFVPINCLSSIIVGKAATVETRELSRTIADENGLGWYQSVIGKSQPTPFFRDRQGNAAEFDGTLIVPTSSCCKSCNEPIPRDRALCSWCSISHADEVNAARSNPLRILSRYGILDQYYKGVDQIERGRKDG